MRSSGTAGATPGGVATSNWEQRGARAAPEEAEGRGARGGGAERGTPQDARPEGLRVTDRGTS